MLLSFYDGIYFLFADKLGGFYHVDAVFLRLADADFCL